IPVSPNKEHRDIDAAIVFGCIFPAFRVSEEADECAVVSSPIADEIHFLQERRRDALCIRNAALKDVLHDKEAPEPHHRLADDGNERYFCMMMGALQLARAVADKNMSDQILQSGVEAALALAGKFNT